jgi:hypothetical protein
VEPDCVPAVEVGGTMLRSINAALSRDLPPRKGKLRVTGVCQKKEQIVETRRGVPPTVAVFPAFPYKRGRVVVNIYLAEDSMYAVRGHPLHRAVYGSDDAPDLTSGRTCRRVGFDAEVLAVDPGQLLLERDGRDVVVRAEARTVIDGPVVDGVPRVSAGATLRVTAVRCEGRGRLVARRLRVL